MCTAAVLLGGHIAADGSQQLLATWNRAKGKERDALLWGDEVCAIRGELTQLVF